MLVRCLACQKAHADARFRSTLPMAHRPCVLRCCTVDLVRTPSCREPPLLTGRWRQLLLGPADGPVLSRNQMTDTSGLIHGGFSSLGSYHLSSCIFTTSDHQGLFPLSDQADSSSAHLAGHRGRRSWQASSRGALLPRQWQYLLFGVEGFPSFGGRSAPHAFNLRPDEFDVWHVQLGDSKRVDT